MKNKVLITGANGFLGTQVIKQLLNQSDYEIIALVRESTEETAINKLKRAWWEFPELTSNMGDRINVYPGDITQEKLGLTIKDYNHLVTNVTHIIHTAADLRLNTSLDELNRTNLHGTCNLLELAHNINRDHGLKRFSHVSTAYVAGAREGVITEDSLTSEYGFLSNYEESKFESELQVKNSGLPVTIFRPSMITGDTQTGYIKTFNTFYVPLRLYLTGKQRILPVKSSNKINLIPVDYVAYAITILTFKSDTEGLTFHLTLPYDELPSVAELINYIREWAVNHLDYKPLKPLYLPFTAQIIEKLADSNIKFSTKTRRLFETIKTLKPYLEEDRVFNRDNTDKYMGQIQFDWKIYLSQILEYAVYYGFFHRSTRTVHEQILYRLKSHTKPVEYIDIIKGKFHRKSAALMYTDIISVMKSLKNLNINKGDTIALVGFNSTKYLTLDVAIGLTGAITVPLYYTSSPDDLKEIIKDSHAKILFIDAPNILQELKPEDIDVTVISLTNFDKVNLDIISWDEFIDYGLDEEIESLRAPVNFEDIATIRYTSGTTGKPRGVTFTHGNLRWMAEYVASMPPWKLRTSEVHYLSFLPLNHVVEGILALYSPYYAPAKLNLYYLRDFHELPDILTRVRPNIFFSVPRFYEKIWDKLGENKIVKWYLNRDGFNKKLLLPVKLILKYLILKKTGLDRCNQLIVGSAPVSSELLSKYQELGVEIYNAYGLTEAPLISINRLGFNKIGTVGKPLPHTNITIGDDGEVMVKGPQVTKGYFNSHDSPLTDDWLATGDYGCLTPDNHLMITGRKKDLIINSYGKSINPFKTESMIRDIPHVNEAILIGEGKPYITALLWINETNYDTNMINKTLKMINKGSSNPEKIKRWAIPQKPLTIKDGDLTANLKLKRLNINRKYEDIIKFLYDENSDATNILYYNKNM